MGLTFALSLFIAAAPAGATVSQDEAVVSEKLSAQVNEFLASMLGPGRGKAVVSVEGESAKSSSQTDLAVTTPPPPTPTEFPGYNSDRKEPPAGPPEVRRTHQTSSRDGGLNITRIRVSVVLDATLPADKAADVEKLLPDFLHLDGARGDELKIIRAALHRPDWKAIATAYVQSKEGLGAATMLGGSLLIVMLAGLLLHFTAGSAIRTFMRELSRRHGGGLDPDRPGNPRPASAAPELLSGSIPSLSLDEDEPEATAAELPMLGHRFDFLTSYPPAELTKLLVNEPPKDVALLLATLSATHPDLSAGVLGALALDVRAAVTLSLAGLTTAEPDALDAIERRLKHLIDFGVQGSARLGQILSRLPADERDFLLTEVASTKPEIAKEIERSMFSFEDIVHLNDVEFRRLITGVPYPDWGLALRGAPENVSSRVMSELGEGIQGMLKDAMDSPHPRFKILEARSKVISHALSLVASGDIVLKRDESTEMI